MSTPLPERKAPWALPDHVHAAPWWPRTLWHWLLLNLLAGAMYWVAAWFGAAAAVGSSSVSVLWPPAGVGLALVLTWGPGVLPGLFLGSLLPQSMLDLTASMDGSGALLTAAVLRLGGLGQWLAVWLLVGDWSRRLVSSGSAFAAQFVLCVLGACLLAPSIGTATLIAMGRLPTTEWLSAWFSWWIGDSAGMLIITPLLLVALHKPMRRQFVVNQAFPCLSLGLGLTLAGTALLGHLDHLARSDRARAELLSLSRSLETQMALAEADLSRLGDLHYGLRLTAAEFEDSASQLRAEHPWLAGFAYLAKVNHGQRSALEADLDQYIKGLNAQGQIQISPTQSSYWPVTRLSPFGGQETRLGVDEASDPTRREALQTALQTRRPSISSVIDRLQHAENDRWGLVLYRAVFENRPAANQAAEATGAVSVSLELQTLVQQALKDRPRLEFPVLLLSPGAQRRGLLVQGGELLLFEATRSDRWMRDLKRSDRMDQTVRFADASWQLVLNTSAGSMGLLPSRAQLASLLLGLGATGLLTALLVARARRDLALANWRKDLEAEVAKRTKELADLNRQLRDQAQERENAALLLRLNSEQLAQRETLLRTLLRHIPLPIWLKDPQGKYLLVNAALERLVGRPARELLGKTTAHYQRGDVATRSAALDGQALSQREAVEIETELDDGQGRRMLTRQTRVALRDEQGQQLGVLGLAQDITEQRRRETELQRFRALADSAAQGFALARMDGRLIYLNATAQRWLDVPAERQSRVLHARRFFAAQAWQRVLDEVLPAVRAGRSWNGLLPLRTPEGHVLDQLQASFFALREQGDAPQFVALLLTDISERLELQNQLEQARDNAENANRAKSVFLSNISHEIRTPLNAVLGYAQLLGEDRNLPAKASAQINSIYQAGQRLLRLINDVLDLSKIEAGVIELSPEPCELQAELTELLRLMQARAEHAKLQLDLHSELPAALVVRLDRGKLGQVLLNLLGNAIKFTPAGGRVLLRARLDAGGELRLTVQDNGPGIAPGELAELFQPFRQGQSGNKLGGTGLGLSLSRKLVQVMGGELWLDSTLGEGTRAQLRLPLQRLDAALAASSLDTERFAGSGWRLDPATPCRVLVAEDDPDSQALLRGLLEKLGCTVDCADDGAQALRLALASSYNIVFSDIQMPNMDGLALRAALADHVKSAHWPVVAVTASSLLLLRDDYLRQGFADYIAKPYPFSLVLDALDRLAGVRLLAPPAPGTQPPAREAQSRVGDGADDVSLPQALAWAQQGRALELRQWLGNQPTAISPASAQALRDALARYDVQQVEALLTALVQAAPQPP